jgi:hypothetical protein
MTETETTLDPLESYRARFVKFPRILSHTRAPDGWYSLVDGMKSKIYEWAIMQDSDGFIWTDTYCRDNDRALPDSMMDGYTGREWEQPADKRQ